MSLAALLKVRDDGKDSELSELRSRFSALLAHSVELEGIVQGLRHAPRVGVAWLDEQDRPKSVQEEINTVEAVR